MRDLWNDVRYAARAVRAAPGVALIAVLSMGLGVGATATIYSWIDGVVLRPFPAITRPDELVGLELGTPSGGAPLSYPTFQDWRRASRSFSDIAAWTLIRASVREQGDEGSSTRLVTTVSGSYFDVLGVRAPIGRVLDRADDETRSPVVVLSHAYWSDRYHADPGILGRVIFLNGQPFTVVGIAPARFAGVYVGVIPDLFVPISVQPRLTGGVSLTDRRLVWLQAVARLRPGVTPGRAAIELDAVARRLSRGFGDHPVNGAIVKELRVQFLGGLVAPVFLAMLAITAVLLATACANIAGLLLVRAEARAGEIAVRYALGAPASRIARLVICESAMLAAAGAVLAMAVAYAARGVLYSLIPAGSFAISLAIEIRPRTWILAMTVTALVALICAWLPALAIARVPPRDALTKRSRSIAASGSTLRSAVVVVQLAASLACLAIAALFVRGLEAASSVDPGFRDPQHVLLVGTDFSAARLSDTAAVAAISQVLERVRALPGVRSVSAATMVPLGFGGRRFAEVRVEGYAPRADEDMSATRVNVAPSYASTMGIAIRAGREITADDGPGTLPVALVNETFAHHFWPSGSAIGRRIDLGRGWMTIVGVLADGKYEKLDEAPQAVAYVPLTQWWQPAFTIHVRTDRNARLLIESVRRALHQVNVDLPVIQPRTLAEHAAASTFVERVGASVLGAFGLAAFALSVLGLYGTLAFTVAARRRELAIRLALGASRRSVVAMVARHAVRVTAGGLVCGIVLALLAGAFVRAQIPRMRMADPIVYVAACGALLLAAVVAAWLPARRAVRIDPAAVLQSG